MCLDNLKTNQGSYFNLLNSAFWGWLSQKISLKILNSGLILKTFTYHFLYCFLSIHETFWYGIGCQDLVSLSELLEENSIGEALSTDSDSLQHTITSQLFKYQWGVKFPSLVINSKINLLIIPKAVKKTLFDFHPFIQCHLMFWRLTSPQPTFQSYCCCQLSYHNEPGQSPQRFNRLSVYFFPITDNEYILSLLFLFFLFIIYKYSYISYFSTKTYVVGTQKNRLLRQFFLAPKTYVKTDG